MENRDVDYNKEYTPNEVLSLLKDLPANTEVIDSIRNNRWKLFVMEIDEVCKHDLVDITNEGIYIGREYAFSELSNMKFKIIEKEWFDIENIWDLMKLLDNDEIEELKIDSDIYVLHGCSELDEFQFDILIRYDSLSEIQDNCTLQYTKLKKR